MRIVIASVLLVFVIAVAMPAFGPGVTAEEQEFEFVGVKKCKMCHKKAEEGEQFTIWSESKHAKAYEVLASDESLAEAKKLGIENPQEAPECLKCHVTAFPVMGDIANQKITMEEGVSCESCHGPGSAYAKKSVKMKVKEGEIEAASVGLLEVTEETCTRCHQKEGNPFFKEFVFADRVKEIAHPIPESSEAEGSK